MTNSFKSQLINPSRKASSCLRALFVVLPILWALIPGTASGQAAADALRDPVYRAPQNEDLSPARVIGRASRGAADESLSIAVLAPDHTGLTVQAQPTLHWHLSHQIRAKVVVTVQHADSIDPLIEIESTGSFKEGIVSVPISGESVELEIGTEYDWSVTIQPTDDEQLPTTTSAVIKRIAEPKVLERARRSNHTLANMQAENGIWYDAIETLTKKIRRSPNRKEARRHRASLLRQVGLMLAAQSDERATPPEDQSISEIRE